MKGGYYGQSTIDFCPFFDWSITDSSSVAGYVWNMAEVSIYLISSITNIVGMGVRFNNWWRSCLDFRRYSFKSPNIANK
jgi:hypothetical protein